MVHKCILMANQSNESGNGNELYPHCTTCAQISHPVPAVRRSRSFSAGTVQLPRVPLLRRRHEQTTISLRKVWNMPRGRQGEFLSLRPLRMLLQCEPQAQPYLRREVAAPGLPGMRRGTSRELHAAPSFTASGRAPCAFPHHARVAFACGPLTARSDAR